MTWASYEFVEVVQKRMKQKLSVCNRIKIAIIAAMSIAAWVLFFYVPTLCAKLAACICVLIGIAFYVYLVRTFQPETYRYADVIREEGVKNVQNDMIAQKLPLSVVGEVIKADIEEELKRIEKVKERRYDFLKKLMNTLIVVPCGFLLALLFQAVFNTENLITSENLYASFEMILTIFGILLLVCLLVIALYIPADQFIKYMTGEDKLQLCLEVFKEIEISNRCDHYEKEAPLAHQSN